MRVCGMRTGIAFTVDAADRAHLEAIVADRNRPQKHVWRARIILLTSADVGTSGIERETGTRSRLKRGVFHSIVDLQAAIKRFLAETNADPKPFIWTANPDKIIAAVDRGRQVLDSIH